MFTYDEHPNSMLEAVLWPAIWFVIAAAICYFAYKAEWAGRKALWKWAALVPLLIGLVQGISAVMLVTNSFYDQLLLSKKVTYALWADFALPVLGILGFGYWQYWTRRQQDRY